MPKTTQNKSKNRYLTEWNGPLGLPEFGKIADSDFREAFTSAMAENLIEIDQIAENRKKPTFRNTITALEKSGESLNRIAAIFFNRASADTNPDVQKLERELSPELSRHGSKIAMNRKLFKRIDRLWKRHKKLDLSGEQVRVLERYWKSYVRSGAALNDDGQKELASINEKLASLGTQFGQNILADEAAWSLILTEGQLSGIPPFLKTAMKSAAEERGKKGKFAVTLSRSIIVPFLTFADDRELREQAFRAWIARGANEGEHDNRPLIVEILALRERKAKLLGFSNYAELKLDNTMAKTPGTVMDLLDTVWEKARSRASEEQAELQKLMAAAGANPEVAPWDWRYYAEKLRAERFAFTESEVKPYFALDQVIDACFDVAGRLFGIKITAIPEAEGYHPDVRVFQVTDQKDKPVGLFLGDYFARPSKRSGAWMSNFQTAHKLRRKDGKKGQRPIVYNVMNFAKGDPALLSLDDARTLFHEFGHALHGLLSDVKYPSVSGTAVSRDFVELPSQLFEHWLMVPEILAKYAVHYETGQPIPQALVKKLIAAETFNSGFDTIEYTASAMVDMAWHTKETPKDSGDPLALQKETLDALGMPEAIVMRHASPHFAHVFSGDGYSAGYYSYLWSEVLDADAFAAFEAKGDPFDRKLAKKLKKHIYASGGSLDPEDAWKAFRGKMPKPDAMLKGRGLI